MVLTNLLVSQQFEISFTAAYELCLKIGSWLRQPVGQGKQLTTFDVLAATHLQQVAKKMARRSFVKKPTQNTFKITLTAQEIIVLQALFTEYPFTLYQFMMDIDKAALRYDQYVNYNLKIN